MQVIIDPFCNIYAQSFLAGGTESACPTYRLRQCVGFFKIGNDIWRDNELRDALLIVNDFGNIGVIVQGHDDFAAIVTVDDADFVGRGDAAFASKSATSIHKPYCAFGKFDCDSRVDKHALVGRDLDCSTFASIQIRACGIRRAVLGKNGVLIEFFDFYGCVLHDFILCCDCLSQCR